MGAGAARHATPARAHEPGYREAGEGRGRAGPEERAVCRGRSGTGEGKGGKREAGADDEERPRIGGRVHMERGFVGQKTRLFRRDNNNNNNKNSAAQSPGTSGSHTS